jgi:hypothetical protein
MSQGFTITGTPEGKRPFMDVSAVAGSLRGESIARIVSQAAAIGLAALRVEVNAIGRVTGNLAGSVAARIDRGSGAGASARIGFDRNNGGQHAHLVEFGTQPRDTKTKGIFSSAGKRGRWIGMGSYPTNFISGKEFVRGGPALRPLHKALEKSRAQMAAVLAGRMRTAGTAAIRAGASAELKGSAA